MTRSCCAERNAFLIAVAFQQADDNQLRGYTCSGGLERHPQVGLAKKSVSNPKRRGRDSRLKPTSDATAVEESRGISHALAEGGRHTVELTPFPLRPESPG